MSFNLHYPDSCQISEIGYHCDGIPQTCQNHKQHICAEQDTFPAYREKRLSIITADHYANDDVDEGVVIFSTAITCTHTLFNQHWIDALLNIQKLMKTTVSLIVIGHAALLATLSEEQASVDLFDQLKSNLLLPHMKADSMVPQTALLSQQQLDNLQQRLFIALKRDHSHQHQSQQPLPLALGEEHHPSLMLVKNSCCLHIYIQLSQTIHTDHIPIVVSPKNPNLHEIYLNKEAIEENIDDYVASIIHWYHNMAN